MTKKMLIDATHAEETRVVVVDGNRVDEFDFESLNHRQLAGNIYLAKVTRVEPSLQAAFVEYGGNRHGFLAFSEIHPDYYQIPTADREALLAEEAELARQAEAEPEASKSRSRSRSRSRSKPAAEAVSADADATVASAPLDDSSNGDANGENGENGATDAEFDDAPPPSAAAGEIDIDVPEDPSTTSDGASDANSSSEGDEYEAVGGDDADDATDERASRPRSRQRRYKIQEVIKVRQILLVQVVKEERGNKGAALTTYLSLAGRYCVLMPNTARGGGISRKITNAADRKKLKEIAGSITVPQGAGLIIRTAGSNRTKTEIRRDYEYLLRQWEQIRDLTLSSIAPTLVYEEGSLIKRSIRDLYSREIDEVLIDGERGYREGKDYMKMLMPSHARNVKQYADPLPLFSRFQVEGYLSAMFNPVVQLKSGGYIVIDTTEALVAIDVNSGRSTREASIEDTALRTNLEAAEEAARQMRLRDLAGLIVIDFIDMEERRNNAAVEKKLKDKLKFDRARIQVGRISGFGLLEMSRQRLRPGMIEATTKACAHCHGTGRVRSDDSIALALLRELEEEGVRQRSKEVLIVAPVEIANYLLNQKREHIAMIEGRFGLSVRIEGDASLISPDYRVERFKTASRIVQIQEGMAPVKVAYPEDDEIEDAEEVTEAEVVETTGTDENGDDEKTGTKRKRRRRRRGGAGRSGNGEAHAGNGDASAQSSDDGADTDGADSDETSTAAEATPAEAAPESATEPAEVPAAAEAVAERPKSRRRSRRPAAAAGDAATPADEAAAPAEAPSPAAEPARPASPLGEVIDVHEDAASEIVPVPEDAAPPPRRRERVRKPAAPAKAAAPEAPKPAAEPEVAPEPTPEPEVAKAPAKPVEEKPAETPEPAMAEAGAGDAPAAPEAPRRRGWWSRALGGSGS